MASVFGPTNSSNKVDTGEKKVIIEKKPINLYAIRYVDGYGNKEARIALEVGEKLWIVGNMPLEKPSQWLQDEFNKSKEPKLSAQQDLFGDEEDKPEIKQNENKVDVFQ